MKENFLNFVVLGWSFMGNRGGSTSLGFVIFPFPYLKPWILLKLFLFSNDLDG